jgi:hypothetical protein
MECRCAAMKKIRMRKLGEIDWSVCHCRPGSAFMFADKNHLVF